MLSRSCLKLVESHTFCHACIMACVESEQGLDSCPFCSQPTIDRPVANMYLRNKIASLTVACPNTEGTAGRAGCGWSGQLSHAKDHCERDCALQPMRCKGHGCRFVGTRGGIREHERACPRACPTCPECLSVSAAHGVRRALCEEDIARCEELAAKMAAMGQEVEARRARIRVRRKVAEVLRVESVEDLSVSADLVRGGRYKAVDFGESWLCSDEVATAALLLEGAVHVQRISLMHTGVEPAGLEAFARTLQSMTGLRAIGFTSHVSARADINSLALVAGALKSLGGPQELDLSGNRMGPVGSFALAGALESMGSLQQLSLKKNDIGAEGAGALAGTLVLMPDLQGLDLGTNGIGDDGAAALGKALKAMTSLRQLTLERNDMGAKGTAALAQTFPSLLNLRVLNLDNNGLSAQGAFALSRSMRSLSRLQRLSLAGCGVGAHGAVELTRSLGESTSLQQLELPFNGIKAKDRVL